jgi:hypothetical protein
VSEISGIKQALVQTQALERVQEAARRQGEQQQQTFAASLNRQVDTREHQVNEGERAEEETLDPNAKKDEEEEAPDHRGDGRTGTDLPEGDEDEEGRGRHIDARA